MFCFVSCYWKYFPTYILLTRLAIVGFRKTRMETFHTRTQSKLSKGKIPGGFWNILKSFKLISLQRWRSSSSRGSACLCLWDPRHSPLPVPHPSRPKHGTNRLVQVTKWQKGLWQKKMMVKFAGSPCIHHRPGFSCLHAHPPLHRFNKWDQLIMQMS